MKKKKIISAIAAVAVVASLSIGSLAYFTSQDRVTNHFATGTTDDSNENSGIKINETFDKNKAGNTLPGDTIQKQVSVKNTANYNQLLRVKITKVWKDSEEHIVDSYKVTPKIVKDDKGNYVTKNVITYYNSSNAPKDAIKLDLSLIQLNFGEKNANLGNTSGKWIQKTDAVKGVDDAGYYYYDGVVSPENSTSKLLESVTLSSKAGNIYKNLKFDVEVEAEGVQAANGVVNEEWTTAPSEITALGGATQASK